jgi:hypothetical protein
MCTYPKKLHDMYQGNMTCPACGSSKEKAVTATKNLMTALKECAAALIAYVTGGKW